MNSKGKSLTSWLSLDRSSLISFRQKVFLEKMLSKIGITSMGSLHKTYGIPISDLK